MSTEIISGQSARIRTNELREGTFRANPDYEFALLDQSTMPSFKDKLSAQELADVVSYLASLRGVDKQ